MATRHTSSTTRTIGDEKLNEGAMRGIHNLMRPTEDLIALSGFAFETKVIAVTGERVVITKDDGNPEFSHYLDSMQPARRDDRTLILKIAKTVDHKFHMGQDEWATQLVDLINSQRNIVLNKQEPAPGGSTPGVHSTSSQDAPADAVEDTSLDVQDVSIAEKVQFWQEQDRINQELIPRVIRQSELLAQHVGEHENLPLIAAQAVSNALKEAREEAAALLEAAKAERQEQARQLVNAKAEREEQNRQHEAERNKLVQEAQAERGAQARQHQAQLAGLKTKADQMRNLAIGASAVATVTGITAIILAILT